MSVCSERFVSQTEPGAGLTMRTWPQVVADCRRNPAASTSRASLLDEDAALLSIQPVSTSRPGTSISITPDPRAIYSTTASIHSLCDDGMPSRTLSSSSSAGDVSSTASSCSSSLHVGAPASLRPRSPLASDYATSCISSQNCSDRPQTTFRQDMTVPERTDCVGNSSVSSVNSTSGSSSSSSNKRGNMFLGCQVSDGLLCTKCAKILSCPIQISSCGHRYCKKCATSLIDRSTQRGNCVSDGEVFGVSDLFPDKQALKEVNSLTVNCYFQQDGCQWRGRYTELQHHIQSSACARQQHLLRRPPTSSNSPQHTSSAPAQGSGHSATISSSRHSVDLVTLSELSAMHNMFSAMRNDVHRSLREHEILIAQLQRDVCQEQERNEKLSTLVHELRAENVAIRERIADQSRQHMEETEQLKCQILDNGLQSRLPPTAVPDCPKTNHTDSACMDSVHWGNDVIPRTGMHWGDVMPQTRPSSATAPNTSSLAQYMDMQRLSIESQDSACYPDGSASSSLGSNGMMASLSHSQQCDAKQLEMTRNITSLVSDVSDLGMRMDMLEQSTTDGHFLWKIKDFSEHLERARRAVKSPSLYSPYFYTHPQGYKLCLRMYPTGDGSGKGTHLSLFIVVMEGEYDAVLDWPLRKKIEFRVRDQTPLMPQHPSETFLTNGSSSSFRRPTSLMNVASGVPKLLCIEDLQRGSKFLKADTLFLEVFVSDYKRPMSL